jgi:hypothetical protein
VTEKQECHRTVSTTLWMMLELLLLLQEIDSHYECKKKQFLADTRILSHFCAPGVTDTRILSYFRAPSVTDTRILSHFCAPGVTDTRILSYFYAPSVTDTRILSYFCAPSVTDTRILSYFYAPSVTDTRILSYYPALQTHVFCRIFTQEWLPASTVLVLKRRFCGRDKGGPRNGSRLLQF